MRAIDADALEPDADYDDGEFWAYSKAQIDNAPTIESEPKKGKWIDKSNGIEGAWNYCFVCGEQAIDLYDFCPNCGADMREGVDG